MIQCKRGSVTIWYDPTDPVFGDPDIDIDSIGVASRLTRIDAQKFEYVSLKERRKKEKDEKKEKGKPKESKQYTMTDEFEE